MGHFTNAEIFLAEVIGTFFITFFGNGSIANALLPGTKGHGVGYMSIAFGFGLGVFLAVQVVGHISSKFNPGVALGAAMVGEITLSKLFICLCGEALGGFIAGILVWVTYAPHFQSLAILDSDDPSSHNINWTEGNEAIVAQGLSIEASRYASTGNLFPKKTTVVDTGPSPPKPMKSKAYSFTALQLGENDDFEMKVLGLPQRPMKKAVSSRVLQNIKVSRMTPTHTTIENRIAEDQEIKLAVFCTRPSVMTNFWFFCTWTEFFGTALLTYAAMTIKDRAELAIVSPTEHQLFQAALEPLLLGFLVFVLVLAIGGMTGPALNPARDLMPRLAHFLLPIPGKGSSEWWYSWVPVVGPLAGGVAGALVAKGMKNITASGLA
eukprot:TRINITY_DN12811_c0_g1_i1.p1 TRINITY_DN12811_c0_g1~~TRINITY_DN12811_c0_g1_i1.p1  ORF type:complete len:379 (+),score=71.80 TRINITY_DN12811_c0_g1_i1:130-1266(+)